MEQRLIDANKLDYTCNADECGMLTGCNHCQYNIITKDEIDSALTVLTIPENPTNGDIIKASFPDGIPKDIVWTLQGDKGADWWNSPYERGKE